MKEKKLNKYDKAYLTFSKRMEQAILLSKENKLARLLYMIE